jgi:hypothetical protein
MDQVHYTSPCGWRIIIYLYLILDWLLLGYQDEFSVVQWLNCMISSQCRLDTFFLYRYLSFGRSWCSGDLWFPFLANYGARCLDFGALQKIARLKSCLELLIIQQLPIEKSFQAAEHVASIVLFLSQRSSEMISTLAFRRNSPQAAS